MRGTSLLILYLLCFSCTEKSKEFENWSHYLGDPGRSHFSSLDQISASNLQDLEVAWEYNCPDTGQMQMNAIIVDGTLFGITAALKVFALDAGTGKLKWINGEKGEKVWHSTSRGVSYWASGNDKRVLFTRGDQLIALNASTGEKISSFGNNGQVDLHTGLPEVAQKKFIISNTPGAIYKDLIILPFRVSEGPDAAPGDIRAFNIRDGSLAWTFHVIPYPGEAGYDGWENERAFENLEGIGAGNCWAGLTVDNDLGRIFVPTGSIAPDFYGGNRGGENLFSNCLLALEAETGELIWHQQLTHHDIWDRDLPAPPNLLTLTKDGKTHDVVVQPTKHGYVYVFDRETGVPFFEITEVEVPASNLEEAWPTQPIPQKPAAFARRSDEITAADFSPFAPNRGEIQEIIKTSNKAYYSPPDTTPTLLLPGYDGGAEWGGAGVDPQNGIIYINSNEMAWILEMEKQSQTPQSFASQGALHYSQYCAPCHGSDLSGNDKSGYPKLLKLNEKFKPEEVLTIILHGKGKMPGFQWIGDEKAEAIKAFLFGDIKSTEEISISQSLSAALPYKHTGYQKFLDDNGLPAISPPWGTLNAIDLNSGEYLWKNTFGEVDSLMELGYEPTGTENYGGPIITENGLLIIAATKDGKARIYDRHSGELLWSRQLPAASFATPSTYIFNGKQYIVFACGGEKLGTKPGNKLVAFALR